MSNEPRYATLRDYLALLRRQRLVIVLVAVVFAAAGLAVSVAQSRTYEAQASVSFRDLSQDLRILGVNTIPGLAPDQLAAISAQQVTRPAVASRVKKQLGRPSPSASELRGAITARVAAVTNLVLVQASWGDPGFAAKLANEFARQTIAVARKQQQRQIQAAIDKLQPAAKTAPLTPPTPAQTAAQEQLVTLQTVKSIVRPAEITQPAQPPGAPSSPKPVRNTILGGLVGLAIGLLAAFLRDSLDRRIRGSKDAHEELGYPVLGRIGASALGSAGLASDGRVQLTPADLESFRVLRTNVAFFDPGGPRRSVLVTSGLPEEGKTTVAAALASAAAAAGQRTLLVEGDLRRPAMASRLGVKESPGLSEYLLGHSTPEDILQTHTMTLGRNGSSRKSVAPSSRATATLICITAGRLPDQPAELLASERCRDFLEKVSKAYDLVVIDSSPLLSSVDPLELVPYVDAVMVCVRLSQSTRDEARAVKAALGRLPERPTGVVITGLREREEAYGYYGYADES